MKRVKSLMSTPLTTSEKVTVKRIFSAVDGFVSARMIEVAIGAVRLRLYSSPVVKFPLPVPLPPNGMLKLSIMLSLSSRSRRRVPSPVPVFTVAV